MSSAKLKPREETETFRWRLPASLRGAYRKAAAEWDRKRGTQRLWARDSSLWTSQDEGQWLGWLDLVDEQLVDVSRFKALTAEVQEDGFKHLLLLGMGGASLVPAVFSKMFGRQVASPELLVLDSTDPAQVRSTREKIHPARTLFCISSKSGTTLEPNLFLQYFFQETRDVVGERAGHHFLAITDPGSNLEGVAEKLSFRHVYAGVASIGGRYSVLSDFGLVPHAAAGLDTELLLTSTRPMVEACRAELVADNPGVSLGLLLGVAAAEFGRDKLTLLCSPTVTALGAWLEQLVAGSTGKQGRGLVPIDREPMVPVETYGSQRIFAVLQFSGDTDEAFEEHVAALEAADLPVIRIVFDDLNEIGQIFFQWQVATAVACSVLGVNAFDQPDIEASKAAARQLTEAHERGGSSAQETQSENVPVLLARQSGISVYADRANAAAVTNAGTTPGAVIRAQLDRLQTGDYFALLAFLPMFPEVEERLQHIRKLVLEAKQVPTVVGFGPRFLHSTGQLFKGGSNGGVFLELTCDDAEDLPVPQQGYTFGVVKATQAQEDLEVMLERGRRALRLHFSKDMLKDLDHVCDLVAAAVAH